MGERKDNYFVGGGRLELPSLSRLVPKTSAYTNSATRPHPPVAKLLGGMIYAKMRVPGVGIEPTSAIADNILSVACIPFHHPGVRVAYSFSLQASS